MLYVFFSFFKSTVPIDNGCFLLFILRLKFVAHVVYRLQRDEEDMRLFVRTCPAEFKEYYIQMQVAKRSQAPHLSQVKMITD